MSEDFIKKGFETWIREKLALTADATRFFNGILGKVMGMITVLKPEKDELLTIVKDFKEFYLPFFDASKTETELVNLLKAPKNIDGGNPIVNELYRKFSVVVGVVADTKNVGISEADQLEISVGMKENLLRICEVLELFIDLWSPEMERAEVQKAVDKMADALNRKYNPESFDLYT